MIAKAAHRRVPKFALRVDVYQSWNRESALSMTTHRAALADAVTVGEVPGS